MGKKDTLLERLGDNMAESLGRGPDVSGAGASGAIAPGQEASARYEGRTRNRALGDLDIDMIEVDPEQPRKHFDEAALARLAESIRQKGLLAPIRVRRDEQRGTWVVLCGERRYRAAKRAGLKVIPCVFVDAELSAEDILEEQLVENLHREDLSPMDLARAFAVLMKRHGWSGKELADRLRLTASAVTRTLALLELPADVQEKVAEGAIAPRSAYELSKLDSVADQQELAQQIVAGKLSRDETAQAVQEKRGRKPAAKREEAKPDAPSTTVSYPVSRGAKVAVTIPKRPVTPADVLAVLEEVASMVQAEVQARKKPAQVAA